MPANILNLPQYRVLRVEETDHDYHVTAEPVDGTAACPHCQSDRLTSWGTREQVFKDLPMHGKRVGIYIDTKRLRCQACGKTFSQALPALAENRMMTDRLVKWIGQQALKRTFTALADKAVDKRITLDVPTGRTMGDGSHVFFDTVSPAITISNSEVGYGALSIETGVFTKVCTNLAMIGTGMRKYHTGQRAAISDEVYAMLTDATRAASDKAVWMQTTDLVRAAFDRAKFEATAMRLGKAAEDRIAPEAAVEVIERVGRKFSFNEGERKGILGRLIADADLSRYGLHSAITRYSQDEAVNYDRATELERIGGDVIELAANDWKALAAA